MILFFEMSEIVVLVLNMGYLTPNSMFMINPFCPEKWLIQASDFTAKVNKPRKTV